MTFTNGDRFDFGGRLNVWQIETTGTPLGKTVPDRFYLERLDEHGNLPAPIGIGNDLQEVTRVGLMRRIAAGEVRKL